MGKNVSITIKVRIALKIMDFLFKIEPSIRVKMSAKRFHFRISIQLVASTISRSWNFSIKQSMKSSKGVLRKVKSE